MHRNIMKLLAIVSLSCVLAKLSLPASQAQAAVQDKSETKTETITIPASFFDDFGLQVVEAFKKPFEEEVRKLEGPLELPKWISWLNNGHKTADGRAAYFGIKKVSENALEMRFAVAIRVLAETDWFFDKHKEGAVQTQQVYALRVEFREASGRPKLEATFSTLKQVNDPPERKATQEQAKELSDKLEAAVLKQAKPHVEELQRRLDELSDALPYGMAAINLTINNPNDSVIRDIRSMEDGCEVQTTQQWDNYAKAGIIRIITTLPAFGNRKFLQFRFDKSVRNYVCGMPTRGNVSLTVKYEKERPDEKSVAAAKPYPVDEARKIALRWAPIHHQDVDISDANNGKDSLKGRADYITAINFDGDWDTSNNWANIANTKFKPNAVVYYSVVGSTTHWYILYMMYHPRDWADWPDKAMRDADSHSNDAEGVLLVVRRPSADNPNGDGTLEGAVTVFHSRFCTYLPQGSPLRAGQRPVDGKLKTTKLDGIQRPVTAQQCRGHGLQAEGTTKIIGDGIVYHPSLDKSEAPTSVSSKGVKYKLIDVFEADGLWDHRNDPKTFDKTGSFRGTKGEKGSANPPWKWNDASDGLAPGAIAFDPARLARYYFAFPQQESDDTEYEFNPYAEGAQLTLSP